MLNGSIVSFTVFILWAGMPSTSLNLLQPGRIICTVVTDALTRVFGGAFVSLLSF